MPFTKFFIKPSLIYNGKRRAFFGSTSGQIPCLTRVKTSCRPIFLNIIRFFYPCHPTYITSSSTLGYTIVSPLIFQVLDWIYEACYEVSFVWTAWLSGMEGRRLPLWSNTVFKQSLEKSMKSLLSFGSCFIFKLFTKSLILQQTTNLFFWSKKWIKSLWHYLHSWQTKISNEITQLRFTQFMQLILSFLFKIWFIRC